MAEGIELGIVKGNQLASEIKDSIGSSVQRLHEQIEDLGAQVATVINKTGRVSSREHSFNMPQTDQAEKAEIQTKSNLRFEIDSATARIIQLKKGLSELADILDV